MKDRDDGWDDLVARWEVASIDDVELRGAERALADDARSAPLAEFSPELQAAIVAAALAGAPPAVSRRRSLLGGSRIARSVAGLAALTAVTTLVVLWGGKYSSSTLDYPTAVAILSRGDQDPKHYSSATTTVYRGVQAAVVALREVARRADDSGTVRAAQRVLVVLLAALDGAMPESENGAGIDLGAAVRRLDANAPPVTQVNAIREIEAFAVAGVRAVVRMPLVDEQASKARSRCLQWLRLDLTR